MRQPADRSYPSMRRATTTLVVLLIAYMISFIDRQILSLMVNPIRTTLHISDFQISLLQGLAFAIFFCLMGIPMGRLADHRNRKTIIVMGILIWSSMTVLSGFASSFILLFLFRMGVGAGEAALAPAGYSILSDSFPPEKLVRATSVFAQGSTLGAGLSLLVGGQVVDYAEAAPHLPVGLSGFAPWQLTFLIVGLPGFIVAAVIMAFVQEPRRQGLSRKVVNVRQALGDFWTRRGDYSPLFVCGGLLSVVNFAAVVWFPTHLIRVFHMSPGRVGLILGIIQLGGGVLGAGLGTLLTEWGLRHGFRDAHMRTVILVACLMAISLLAPLLSDLHLTLIIWAFAVTVQSAYAGSIYAALHIISPNQMRAVNTAAIILVGNLFGLAIGSAAISGLAQLMFGSNPAAIGKSIAMVGFCCCVAAAIIGWSSLTRYRFSIEQAESLI
jgi:MFS family permease